MSLEDYDRKRDFELTPEPPSEHPERSEPEASEAQGRFMVHMHDATRLHWDLRLELDGVFKSWAVPKGPSLDPAEKRLAVLVEDHPYEYGEFEGVIPEGNYGAGTTMIWDEGTYTTPGAAGRAQAEGAFHAGLDKGTIKIVLKGTKLEGQFALVRLKDGGGKNWLLIKDRDAFSTPRDILELDRSARTGRSLADIRQEEIGRPRGDRPGNSAWSATPAATWRACACWSWTTTTTRASSCGASSRTATPWLRRCRHRPRRSRNSRRGTSTCCSATSECRGKTAIR